MNVVLQEQVEEEIYLGGRDLNLQGGVNRPFSVLKPPETTVALFLRGGGNPFSQIPNVYTFVVGLKAIVKCTVSL